MICLLVALLVASPFEDIHKRFTVELPVGWRFTPMPGELESVSFQRRRDGIPAQAYVRVFPAHNVSFADLDDGLLSIGARQSGYKLLVHEPVELAGVRGSRHRFVVNVKGDPKLPKMVEERLAIHEGTAYLVHVETLADAFASFEDELDVFFKTLRFPGAPLGNEQGSGELQLLFGPLLGRWVMEDDPKTVLVLRADGTFSLAKAHGTYRSEGDALRMRPAGAGEETFTWRIDGEELLLSAPAVGGTIRYRRATSTRKK